MFNNSKKCLGKNNSHPQHQFLLVSSLQILNKSICLSNRKISYVNLLPVVYIFYSSVIYTRLNPLKSNSLRRRKLALLNYFSKLTTRTGRLVNLTKSLCLAFKQVLEVLKFPNAIIWIKLPRWDLLKANSIFPPLFLLLFIFIY